MNTTEQTSEYTKNFIEKEKKKNEKIKKMMSTTDYVDWINKFTHDISGFSDNYCFYKSEIINDYDAENIDQLCLLYEGIEKYAEQNHIYPTPCNFGNYYRVKLDAFGFEIGVLIGQGAVFFCNKVSIENENEFIDFNDIINGKKQDNVDQINATLDYLSESIITAYENGVPIEAISNTINNTVERIIIQNKQNSKRLIKK